MGYFAYINGAWAELQMNDDNIAKAYYQGGTYGWIIKASINDPSN